MCTHDCSAAAWSHLPEISTHDDDLTPPRHVDATYVPQRPLQRFVAVAVSHGCLIPEYDVSRPQQLSPTTLLDDTARLTLLHVDRDAEGGMSRATPR